MYHTWDSTGYAKTCKNELNNCHSTFTYTLNINCIVLHPSVCSQTVVKQSNPPSPTLTSDRRQLFDPFCQTSWNSISLEPRKKPSYFPLCWLFDRDPYNGSLQSHIIPNNYFIPAQWNSLTKHITITPPRTNMSPESDYFNRNTSAKHSFSRRHSLVFLGEKTTTFNASKVTVHEAP